MSDQTKTPAKVIWHLTFYDPEYGALVADITITEAQARAIWLTTGDELDPDPIGDHAVEAFLGASSAGDE